MVKRRAFVDVLIGRDYTRTAKISDGLGFVLSISFYFIAELELPKSTHVFLSTRVICVYVYVQDQLLYYQLLDSKVRAPSSTCSRSISEKISLSPIMQFGNNEQLE